MKAIRFCSVIAALFLAAATQAQTEIPLSQGYNYDARIDDDTLFFETNHPEYVLNIKDEDDNVVYSTVVSSTQTQIVLPSTLSGDYVIELAVDNQLFTGWINL